MFFAHYVNYAVSPWDCNNMLFDYTDVFFRVSRVGLYKWLSAFLPLTFFPEKESPLLWYVSYNMASMEASHSTVYYRVHYQILAQQVYIHETVFQ